MKRILIFYSHFAPAFKAGGPVQSLVNLVDELGSNFQFFIICESKDIGSVEPLIGITPDAWNDLGDNSQVYYIHQSPYKAIVRAIKKVNPDCIYINGMFLPLYNWFPLLLAKMQQRKVVLAPRGMVQQGALAVKPLKKKLFLFFFKMLHLHKGIAWHATDKQESLDIRHIFGQEARVTIAPNIPKAPGQSTIKRNKQPGQLRLVYLSLITKKKNLYLVLQALSEVTTPIVFDIYGPTSDEAYWQDCKSLMEGQIHSISYWGSVNPDKVQSTLSTYHALILPTNGENFGHAIYEAFSVGTPAIISAFTPWGRLQDVNAGITLDAINVMECKKSIQALLNCSQEEFNILSNGAHKLGYDYYAQNDFKTEYLKLFNLE